MNPLFRISLSTVLLAAVNTSVWAQQPEAATIYSTVTNVFNTQAVLLTTLNEIPPTTQPWPGLCVLPNQPSVTESDTLMISSQPDTILGYITVLQTKAMSLSCQLESSSAGTQCVQPDYTVLLKAVISPSALTYVAKIQHHTTSPLNLSVDYCWYSAQNP